MRYLLVVLWLGVVWNREAKNTLTDWETCRTSKGVELQYRWVNLGDTLTTREMRAIFTIQAKAEDILLNFDQPQKLSQWVAGSRNCSVYRLNNNNWIIHTLLDIPKPLTQKDMLIQYALSYSDDSIVLNMKPVPQYLPSVEGIVRMQNYEGYWLLKPLGDGSTNVEFYSTSFTRPVLPRFIQDPVIQRILIRSFKSLTHLAESSS